MKRFLLYSLLITSLSAAAQMKEGKVVYERTIQMQFRGLGGNPPPEMANMPRERKDKFELSFAANHSLWESIPDMEENNEQSGGGDGNRVVMRFGGGDDLSYTNFGSGKRIEQRALSSKSYVVEDSIQNLNWKLTGETKNILGHAVQKATAERYSTRMVMSMENGEMKREQQPDTTLITAWFAPDIPVPAGPEFQGQLPGLILELNMNNGRSVYQALEISPKVNVAAIKEPKGKRITVKEFEKEREKEMEEMRKNMPPGMQIRTMN
jgi:GLPGLI family protein